MSFEAGAAIQMDDLKGSGSLKQISAQVISLSRDLTAECSLERNTVKIHVLKDRFSGATGPAGAYIFNDETGRLEEAEAPELSEFTTVTKERY
jgi:twinkle protein